jgi:hypothetical protein
VVRLGRSSGRRAHLSCRRDRVFCDRSCADYLWGLVLSENETAAADHMKTKILSALVLLIFSPVGQALACSFCYGAKDGKSTEHMAVAIWFLFGAVMSVLGGIGAFSFHLWRHGRMPAEPYQEITEEDLSKYE